MATPTPAAVDPRRARRPRQRAQVWLALAALVLVLAIGIAFNADGAFFTAYTHSSALWQIAGFGILGCGLTVVILTGGIDLSVGSLVALSGVLGAELAARRGWPDALAIPAAVLAATLCGTVSGSLVAFLRVQPFIATLAMMAFARGLAKWLSRNTKVTLYPPPPLYALLNTRVNVMGLGVSVGVFVFIACTVLTWAVLRLFKIGFHVYAVGDNEEAARYAGVPVRRTKLLAYAFSGALAGLAGVLFAAVERQGNPDGGVGYELTAIAMVVIGGTSLSGGRGGVVLTVLGALTMGYLGRILDINGVETSNQLMLTGGIVVLAVLLQGIRRT
jgi:ribose transport system permease protein